VISVPVALESEYFQSLEVKFCPCSNSDFNQC